MAAESIVTVRMPSSLLDALKQHTRTDHFSDISEQVRSIIRKGCLKYASPTTKQLDILKSELRRDLEVETEDERVKQLLEGLRSLLGGGR